MSAPPDRRTVGSTRRLLALRPGIRLRLSGLVAVLLAITGTYIGQGVLLAHAISGVLGGRDATSVLAPLAGTAVLVAVRAVLLARYDAWGTTLAFSVKSVVRQRLIDKLFLLGPGWMQRSRTGDTQTTLVDGVEAVDPYIGRFLPQTVGAVVGACAVATVIIVIDPLVGVIILVCAAAAPLVPIASSKVLKKRTDAWTEEYWGIYAENLDAVQGMSTLKAFSAARRYGAELARHARDFYRSSTQVIAVWGAYMIAVGLATAVGTAVAVGIGAVHAADGSVSRLELLIILLLTHECFRPMRDLTAAYHDSAQFRSHARRIFEFLDAEPDVRPPVAASPAPNGRPLGLALDSVSFSYRERTTPALDEVSLAVAPGERVAIVGRSGAGKTTLVSLLLRFFDPQRGKILIGDREIRDLPLEELRGLVAVVAQDTFLFHDTVGNNLRLARPEATDEQLQAAARAAYAHEFITELPDGYDTVIGERGLRLSGGQRQRIAIARALLKDAPILILDEATSSIDARNEAGIAQALATLSQGRTTLVIAHRLSTVRDADRVVVLRAGRIAEIGDHAALLAKHGDYAELVSAQAVS